MTTPDARLEQESRWYGVRCIFRARWAALYEERVTLWKADSFDEAIEAAEAEARAYVETCDLDYLEVAQAYEVGEEVIESGVEVFSLVRDSELQPSEYVSQFFDTGRERQGEVSPPQGRR